MARCHEAPAEHDSRLPPGRQHFLEQEIRGNFTNDIRDLIRELETIRANSRQTRKTRSVQDSNKSVLIRRQSQLRHDVLRCAFVHDSRIGGLEEPLLAD